MVEKLEGVSLGEVRYTLSDCAWREVKKAWMMWKLKEGQSWEW